MITKEQALNVLQAQMESGYEVAHKRHSDLKEVRNDVEAVLSFLSEIGLIDSEEFSFMLDYAKSIYEQEKRKEEVNVKLQRESIGI